MKFNKAKHVVAVAVSALVAAPAFATSVLPAGVATGISDAQAAGTEAIGLLAAAGAAVYLISKVLRKFGLQL